MKKLLVIILIGVLSLGIFTGCGTDSGSGDNGGDSGNKTVKLGYVNWSEGIAMTNLAKAILEDKMGYEVDLTMTDAAPLFTSLASGNTDAFLDSWLPITHEDYMKKFGDKVEDLGYNFENARIGLAVPSYVDIDSIEELNSLKAEFGGKIVGIDSGAGIMNATEKAIEEYKLDYELMPGSGPTMTAALKKAIDNEEPIIVTGWEPHWMFAKWDLKFLDDPKGAYGEAEYIHTIARKDLSKDMPEVANFLTNFFMSGAELGDLMGEIENNSDKDPVEIARDWMNAHEDLVNGWIEGK
ncbi:glycine betaine ABC transporter substrate-binding protein [Sinanaerobacter sp. ZZT-01]|uniref:glycine betaine ABC transporter substrate-binding protein n=1 Tax=Sinanaerobacter sp. ZZT-01 TaxID=3111540 RepID=UPI002D76C613|nr:glycine betaine ABC transporter substrate-binding protein [Sinanaerobacter sp. ZZT-01]WRR92301.1 glycine betaine ABC transporter substrate-binding protein [Sinanaerobacter sp. ZZT-01]